LAKHSKTADVLQNFPVQFQGRCCDVTKTVTIQHPHSACLFGKKTNTKAKKNDVLNL